MFGVTLVYILLRSSSTVTMEDLFPFHNEKSRVVQVHPSYECRCDCMVVRLARFTQINRLLRRDASNSAEGFHTVDYSGCCRHRMNQFGYRGLLYLTAMYRAHE